MHFPDSRIWLNVSVRCIVAIMKGLWETAIDTMKYNNNNNNNNNKYFYFLKVTHEVIHYN